MGFAGIMLCMSAVFSGCNCCSLLVKEYCSMRHTHVDDGGVALRCVTFKILVHCQPNNNAAVLLLIY